MTRWNAHTLVRPRSSHREPEKLKVACGSWWADKSVQGDRAAFDAKAAERRNDMRSKGVTYRFDFIPET